MPEASPPSRTGQRDLTSGPIAGTLLAFALPTLGSNVLQSLNGSINAIAGIANERGNVVGLMPHPEHAVEPGFGPDTDAAMRSGTDGLTIFASAISALTAA